LLIPVFLLFLLAQNVHADINSTTGTIALDVNKDGSSEATFNSRGLGIATEDILSTLQINGSLGMNLQLVNSDTILSGNSIVIADTTMHDLTLTLPYAGNVAGRMYMIKKKALQNTLMINGGGNLIDLGNDLKMTHALSALPFVQIISDGTQWFTMHSTQNIGEGNLVGGWNLDDDTGSIAHDSSGYESDGVLVGGFSFGSNSLVGKVGNALDFGSGNQYVIVNDADHLDLTTKFTLMAWVNLNSLTSLTYIFVKEDINVDSTGAYEFYLGAGGQIIYATNNTDSLSSSSGIITTGAWHHIVVTFDNDASPKMNLYHNGLLVKSGDVTSVTPNSGSLLIGRRGSNATPYYLDGKMDDIRIYNKTLSLQEIMRIYSLGI